MAYKTAQNMSDQASPSFNQSLGNESTACDQVDTSARLFFLLGHSLVFLVGLLLNGFTLKVYFCRAQQQQSSSVTVYLKNLVAADFLISLCLPLRILNYASTSVHIHLTVRAAHIISTLTWLFLLATPETLIPVPLSLSCDALHSQLLSAVYKVIHSCSVLIFLLVLVSLVFFYHSTSRRLKRCSWSQTFFYLKEVTVLLSVLNVCLDPLIYFIFCKAFRAQLNLKRADGGEQCIVNDQMGPFTVLYTLVFIIRVPGNLLSVWIFIRSRRVKRRSLSVYLLNLLLSDLLLLLALPFKILKDGGAAPWSLKVFHCQASAGCTSLRSMWLQGVGFSWLLSVVKGISLHWHALTVVLCTALFLNASFSVLLSSFLSLRRLLGSCKDPLLRADARRAAVSVTSVALAYIVGFVPYHVVRALHTLTQTKVITECSVRRKLFLGKEATLLLSVLHLCFDPLIFYYLHEPFRQTLRNMMPCWRKKRSEEEGKAAEEEAAEGKAAVEQDLQSTLI
ncbi:hypothetical protein F7725_021226 [Dissostichus mawsoni]|uniref:G-protein coupled receptors family 1 profile domain-containing protein n=1 Tax=Dissostichus mawsoni TaxID=36200 RepID=A0A7J5YIS8_DISMA|nr:hypothetical protein F7725_021226 [Dissostichus mawsoni]